MKVVCDYTNCYHRNPATGLCGLSKITMSETECQSVKPIYTCGDCKLFDTPNCPASKYDIPIYEDDDSGGIDGVCFIKKDGVMKPGVM